MGKNKVYLVSLLLLAMLLVGCGSKVDSVKIKLSADSVDIGEEVLLTALGYSDDGSEIKLYTKARWALNYSHVGDIRAINDAQAIFRPEAEGPERTGEITVFVGKASDSATVRIGEKIIATKAIDFTQQGGGIVQPLTTLKYPCISQWNNQDHWVEWDFDILKTSYYTPVLMYSTEASVDVYRSLSINQEEKDNIIFPKINGINDSSNDWKTVTLDSIFLEAGKHTLRLGIPDNGAEELKLAWLALVYPRELAAEKEQLITSVDKILKF